MMKQKHHEINLTLQNIGTYFRTLYYKHLKTMRKASLRPYSAVNSGSIISGESSSRKGSSVIGNPPISSEKTSLLDDCELEGKVKVSTTIHNSDVCMSVSYRPDGRFYAVALASGIVHVYNTRTDNILYTLNNENKDLPFTDISATCVRFKPFQPPPETGASFLGTHRKSISGRRKSAGLSNSLEHFLPPIQVPTRPSQQYLQRRRKSSVSALGLRSIADELGWSSASDQVLPNNLVVASFTDGAVKTYNFVTEQCLNVIEEDRETLTLNYSVSGSTLATGGGNGKILVYDDETKSLKCSHHPPFQYNAELLRTYSIAFVPTSEFEFVSGGWNRSLQFYDTRVPNLLTAKIDGPKVCGEGISFHPSGTEFCTAAWGKGDGLQFYDYATQKPIFNIRGCLSVAESAWDSSKSATSKREPHPLQSSFLYSARYFLNNYVATGGAHPGSVTVVERKTGNTVACVKGLKKSVYGIDTFKSKVLIGVDKEVTCVEVFI